MAELGIHEVSIEAIRLIEARRSNGVLAPLSDDILGEGLRHPVTLWADGTLISGGRRVRAHLRKGMPSTIRAVFVDTIEDAAKRLLIDNQDDRLAMPMKPTDICRLWEVLKRLDGPAAAKRTDEARRRGVELRKAAMSGKRPKGRGASGGDEYAMGVLAEPFGMSESTASRLWMIWRVAQSEAVDPKRRELAREALAALDAGQASIWSCYAALLKGRSIHRPQQAADLTQAKPAATQLAAWDRVLPELTGIVAGLTELGPPNADLTWDQIGPVCARLSAVRRDLEKTIKQMKERSSK